MKTMGCLLVIAIILGHGMTVAAALKSQVEESMVKAGELMIKGRFEEAIEKLDSLSETTQKLGPVLLLRAQIYVGQKNWPHALDSLDKVPTEDQKHRYWFLRFQSLSQSIPLNASVAKKNEAYEALKKELFYEHITPADTLKDAEIFLKKFLDPQSVKIFCKSAAQANFRTSITCGGR